jgi:hypothetical protein
MSPQKYSASDRGASSLVEPVEVHNLGPGGRKTAHKFRFAILLRVYVGNGA